MGSQFVDLDGDGHIDYLSATFDGSPHVAYGSEQGFAEPVHLLDADGRRIILSHIWDYDAKKHDVVGRAMGTDSPRAERCISALAYDWDADGDFDLLLGGYEHGCLYRQMNEGSNAEPKFTGTNIPVMAGDEPFAIEAKMTAPRLVDWDGDGDLDILTGSFGDCWGEDAGGGVFLTLDLGEPGAPRFGPLQTLIPPSRKGHTEPVRPDAGLYPDAVDWDGDGDLDLVVGGYSMWKPVGRELSADERATAAELKDALDGVTTRQRKLTEELMAKVEAATQGLEQGGEEWRQKYAAIAAEFAEQRTALAEEAKGLRSRLDELVPSAQRQAFVWVYERLPATAEGAGSARPAR